MQHTYLHYVMINECYLRNAPVTIHKVTAVKMLHTRTYVCTVQVCQNTCWGAHHTLHTHQYDKYKKRLRNGLQVTSETMKLKSLPQVCKNSAGVTLSASIHGFFWRDILVVV